MQISNSVAQALYYEDDIDTLVLDCIGSLIDPSVQVNYFGENMIEDNASLEGKGIWLMIV